MNLIISLLLTALQVTTSHFQYTPQPRSYDVIGNKNADLTVRLLSDIEIPDELNWPIFVPSVYSDSHELRREASVSNAESSARVGISIRSDSEDRPQISYLGFNDDNKLEMRVSASSLQGNVANLKWTLSYNQGTEIATEYVSYDNGIAIVVFDDEIGGGGLIDIASTSATYLVNVKEVMNNLSEGESVYARIQTIGSSQVIAESFGVNQNGNLEAVWQLTSSNHYCEYVLLKGSNIVVASGTTLPGVTSIEFQDIDLEEHQRRRLFSSPSSQPSVSEPRSIHDTNYQNTNLSPEMQFDWNQAQEAQIVLERATASTGISIHDFYSLLRSANTRTAPRVTRSGKAADLDNDVTDQGNLHTLSSPQGSAAAARAYGYTFRLLGMGTTTTTSSNESSWSPEVDSSSSSSTSTTTNSSSAQGIIYTLLLTEYDTNGHVTSSSIASSSYNTLNNVSTIFPEHSRVRVLSFGINTNDKLEVRWSGTYISSNIHHYRCTLRRSDWPEVLEIGTVQTHGNESMNIFVFENIDTSRISAVYSVLVEEIDIDDNIVDSASASISITKHENHISVSSIQVISETNSYNHVRHGIEVNVSLSNPISSAFHFVLRDENSVVLSEGIERSSSHVFWNLVNNTSSSIKFYTVDVSEIADGMSMSLSDNSFTPELIVKSVQLKVRGLRHPSPEDLRITLSHLGRSVTVLREGRLANRRLQFGARSSLSSSSYTLSPQKAFDYIFDDESLGRNLALGKIATQDSTKYQGYAAKAVDGNIDGHFSSGSVTHTGPSRSPWWQVDLGSTQNVRTMRVWSRQEESPIDTVSRVEIYSDYPLVGTFTLTVTYNGIAQTTEPIQCDAVSSIGMETTSTGASLQRRLMELSNVNHEVKVRSVTPDAGSLHDHPYVRHWLITFNIPRTGVVRYIPRLSAPMPSSAVGLNHPSAAVTILSLSDILASDRRGLNGRYVQRDVGGDGMYAYNKRARSEAMSPLWPMWLVFFQDTPPAFDLSFEESLEAADFKIRLDENSNLVQATSVTGERENLITFETPILARHIRIQLEPSDVVPLLQDATPGVQRLKSLCLAEVQIFENPASMVMNYRGGSPIVPGHYVSEKSLTEAFRDTTIGGTWMLTLKDTQNQQHSGSLDDYQLLVTDQYGIEHIYYTDLHASVTKLPTHGTLHRVDTAAYGVTGSDRGEKLSEVYGEVTSRSTCYGNCAHRFEVGVPQSAQRRHSTAAFNWILTERLLVYVPNRNFVGEDSFSYRLGVRGTETPEEGTIRVRVKDCRSTIQIKNGVETRLAVTTSRDIISGRSATFCHDDPGNEILIYDWASRGGSGLRERVLGITENLPRPDPTYEIPDNPTFYNPRCVDGDCSSLNNLGTTHSSIGTEPSQPVYYSYHHPGNS